VLLLLQTKTSFGNMKVGVVPYMYVFFWKKKNTLTYPMGWKFLILPPSPQSPEKF